MILLENRNDSCSCEKSEIENKFPPRCYTLEHNINNFPTLDHHNPLSALPIIPVTQPQSPLLSLQEFCSDILLKRRRIVPTVLPHRQVSGESKLPINLYSTGKCPSTAAQYSDLLWRERGLGESIFEDGGDGSRTGALLVRRAEFVVSWRDRSRVVVQFEPGFLG